MSRLPDSFEECVQESLRLVTDVEGYMSAREIRFLSLLAACPTAEGAILELGSYKGKSSIAIARANQLADAPTEFVTVDPLPPEELNDNLNRAGVRDIITTHNDYSDAYFESTSGPVRMFFHDGCNEEPVVRADFASVLPRLADGAVVAFHDVLNCSGDRIRIFRDDVLTDERFGPVGVLGSIGWAQFRSTPQPKYAADRTKLAKRLRPLVRYQTAVIDEQPNRLQKLYYRLLRSRIPHRKIDPNQFLKRVA